MADTSPSEEAAGSSKDKFKALYTIRTKLSNSPLLKKPELPAPVEKRSNYFDCFELPKSPVKTKKRPEPPTPIKKAPKSATGLKLFRGY